MTKRPGPLLLAETGVRLAVASLQLRVRPFRNVMKRISRLGGAGSPVSRADAELLSRALKAWERRLPWRARCFEQAIVAHRWLTHRGHAACVHYGARGEGDALEAHVWVTSGQVPVVGCENAADFRELARYPDCGS